jgi:hypothetical protein
MAEKQQAASEQAAKQQATNKNSGEEEFFFQYALLTSLNRIYDTQLMILSAVSKESQIAIKLREMHANGKYWSPPPFMPENPSKHE